MHLTILGSGTSHGVPMIDCMLANYARCPKGVCREAALDPRHRRSRCCALIEHKGRSILLDVSMDFREQALREKIGRIDAVLLTHGHADHIGGIPDIRSYSQAMESPLDMYGSAETLETVRRTYAYVFDPDTFVGGGIPRLNTIAVDGPFEVSGLPVTSIPVHHGALIGCFGYRIGDFAYVPDMKSIDDCHKEKLRGLECLVLNCLRDTRPHPTHLLLEESMALARELAPRQCIFVHMSHDIHYKIDSQRLEPWMSFGWDGMRTEIA